MMAASTLDGQDGVGGSNVTACLHYLHCVAYASYQEMRGPTRSGPLAEFGYVENKLGACPKSLLRMHMVHIFLQDTLQNYSSGNFLFTLLSFSTDFTLALPWSASGKPLYHIRWPKYVGQPAII